MEPKLPLIHLWLPDHGFRKARARTLAAIKANSDHTVFIDGDCLLLQTFQNPMQTWQNRENWLPEEGSFRLEHKPGISSHTKQAEPIRQRVPRAKIL